MAEPDARARREYGTALVMLAGGGALLLVAYGLTWCTVTVPLLIGSDGTLRQHQLTGHDLFPAAAVAGWVAIAGVGGIIATRSWGRVAVAVLCALAGLAGSVVAIVFAVAPEAAIQTAVAALGRTPAAAPPSVTLGWLLAAVAGALVAATGAWAAVRGPGWPRLGNRYERTPRTVRATSAWDAQDLGHDPSDDLVE